MAKKKTGGSLNQHKGRAGKRRGIKIFGDQKVQTGQIIVRQKGTKYHPADGVGVGRDHTLFALKEGKVKFSVRDDKRFVSVV